VEGVKYEGRACCEIGSNVPSEMCPNEIDTSDGIDTSNEISIGIIVGSSIASLCVICCCGWVFYKKCYKRETNTPEKVTLVSVPSVPAAVISSTNSLPVGSVVSSSHVIPEDDAQVVASEGINAVMPPSAPPMNPSFNARS
jgi:hypothetical protein